MRSVAFFVLFAATILVAIVFGEPVKYRQNQRAKASAKQTVETSPAEGNEDDDSDGKTQQPAQPNVQKLEGPFYALRTYPNGPLLVLPLELANDQSNDDSTTVESTTSQDDLSPTTDNSESANAGGPYPPSGWKPLGRLFLLPNEQLTATTTQVPAAEVPTTVVPATKQTQSQGQQKGPSGRLVAEKSEQDEIAVADNTLENVPQEPNENVKDDAEEIETTTELKKENASGKLEAESPCETTDESRSDTTTEAEATTTQQTSSKLETTSEPDSEAVEQPKVVNNVQPQPPVVGAAVPPFIQAGPGAFLIQLPDGSLQRFVFVAASNGIPPSANLAPNQLVPVATSPFQELAQPQAVQAQQPFGYNPIAAPRVVTFSSQYQSFKWKEEAKMWIDFFNNNEIWIKIKRCCLLKAAEKKKNEIFAIHFPPANVFQLSSRSATCRLPFFAKLALKRVSLRRRCIHIRIFKQPTHETSCSHTWTTSLERLTHAAQSVVVRECEYEYEYHEETVNRARKSGFFIKSARRSHFMR